MKKLVTKFNLDKIKKPILSLSAALTMAYSYFVVNYGACANGNAGAELMIQGVISMATKVAVVLGVVIGIFGFISYLAAKSEGDGPATHKAQQQISAAILLVLGGIILGFVPWASILTA